MVVDLVFANVEVNSLWGSGGGGEGEGECAAGECEWT